MKSVFNINLKITWFDFIFHSDNFFYYITDNTFVNL